MVNSSELVPNQTAILQSWSRSQKASSPCGYSTGVVRLLAKEKVVGPNPITRSKKRALIVYLIPFYGNGNYKKIVETYSKY